MGVDQNQLIMNMADNIDKIKNMQVAVIPSLGETINSFATTINDNLKVLMDLQRGQFLMQRAQLLMNFATLTHKLERY